MAFFEHMNWRRHNGRPTVETAPAERPIEKTIDPPVQLKLSAHKTPPPGPRGVKHYAFLVVKASITGVVIVIVSMGLYELVAQIPHIGVPIVAFMGALIALRQASFPG